MQHKHTSFLSMATSSDLACNCVLCWSLASSNIRTCACVFLLVVFVCKRERAFMLSLSPNTPTCSSLLLCVLQSVLQCVLVARILEPPHLCVCGCVCGLDARVYVRKRKRRVCMCVLQCVLQCMLQCVLQCYSPLQHYVL